MSVIITGCTWRQGHQRTTVPSAAVSVATSPAPAEPITLEEAQAHLKQPASTPEDDLVTRWIRTARSLVERRTAIAIVPHVWDFYLDHLGACPGSFVLPWWPVVSVDEFVRILEDDTEVAFDAADYWTMLMVRPALVGVTRVPARSDLRLHQNVRLRLTVGYEHAAEVPPELVQAMYLLVGYFSRYRGDDASKDPLRESGAQAFLDRFILPGVA